jgi:hypothetical protein
MGLRTPVLAPFDIVISSGRFVLYEPQVKSGILIEFESLATDHSLNGTIELHVAAS